MDFDLESISTEKLWSLVRRSIVGWNTAVDTPFGERRLTYADYTASGRVVSFIEDYMRRTLELYGNTHTEDDATGIATSQRLRAAELTMKRLLHAGPEHRLITVGAGTTAAVHLLQQILGVYVPPAARDALEKQAKAALHEEHFSALAAHILAARPVVLVGPYEHHSNEVSWRECLAEVVEVELAANGLLDLEDLRRKVSRAQYARRLKIGAFSAASNVSGVKTPVYEVAKILHRNGALAFFDFAAIAPYERIDVNRDEDSYFDAVYFSPHKFLGGPGSGGILVLHKKIYRADLPPTVGAGGTVDYVNFDSQEYSPDIEVRETPGTPGILQTLRAAIAMELKEALGIERIEKRERELTEKVEALLSGNPLIELLGNAGAENRLPIFSFNVKVGPSYLHPRFVATLLNDLFGIQSRAGCSCAAPYGHRLLHIDEKKSRDLKRSIMGGDVGLKPGWVRVNFHFLHTDEEVDFILEAIRFTAESGKSFLPLYWFDIHSGSWRHRDFSAVTASFSLEEALRERQSTLPSLEIEPSLEELFKGYMEEARSLARRLDERNAGQELKTTEKDLIPFVYI